MVAKMPTIVGDSSNATTHEIYLIFRLSIKGKIVSIHCNKSKTLGRSPSTPSSLYHGGGLNLRVRPSVNSLFNLQSRGGGSSKY